MTHGFTRLERLDAGIDELLADHGGGRLSLAELARFANDPLGFARVYLGGLELGWEPLERIARAVQDKPLVVVPGAMGCGKDFVSALLALHWVYCRGGKVVVSAVREQQLLDVVMATIAMLFRRNPDLPGRLLSSRLEIPGSTAGIISVIGRDVSAATGIHHPQLLAIVSEAQGVPDHVWEAAMNNASAEHSRVLAAGNPLQSTGMFHQVCQSPEWEVIRLDGLEHPNIVQGREVIPGAISLRGIENIAAMFGEGSPQYLARVRGMFPSGDIDGQLVPGAWLQRAHDNSADPDWKREEILAASQAVVGVDVARGGADSSVAVLRRGPRVFPPVVLPVADTQGTADHVMRLCREWGLAPDMDPHFVVVTDVIGVGAGVVDALRRRKWPVREFNASETAKFAGKEVANCRAEAYWGLRKLLEDERVCLPDDPTLAEELLTARWLVDGTGRVAIESKDQHKRRLNPQRSPDRADAVVIACHGLWRGSLAPVPSHNFRNPL